MSNQIHRIQSAMNLINGKVNLIGVVTEVGIPKRTQGTDYFCTLRISDEPHPTSGISINFFEETFEKLPQVESAGDIIQLFGVVVRRYQSKVNAVYYKDSSTFALYKGNEGSTSIPYQISSKFRGREQDGQFISDFRWWATGFQPGKVLTDSVLLRLGQLSQGTGFNLVCKVVHICEVREGEWMLFVWDGTDAPPVDVDARLEQESAGLQLEGSPLSRDVLCGFPTVGTVLRMTADPCSGGTLLGLHTLKAAGKWVYFKNIKFEVRFGLWCGLLLPDSKFTYLSDNNTLVGHYERKYERRLKRQLGRMPWSSLPWPSHLTVTDHQNVPFVTLMDMLTYPEVTYKYRCVVRVLATFPSQPGDWRGPCGNYRLRLTLEDPTARIHAYIFDKDGVKFFGGYPSTDKLIKMHNALLGVEETNGVPNEKPRNPPWVACCLKSYYVDKSNQWGSRTYGICDTKLVV